MTNLSNRGRMLKPSVTLELSALARGLQDAGRPVINLTAGEPDFPTPELVVEAAHHALREKKHFWYTPTPGVKPLREKIAQVYAQRLGVPFTFDQTVVTNGAKQALFDALAAVTDPGDRVGILTPYWVTYVEQARILGCEPVEIPCPADGGFRPDLEVLERELGRGLRVLMVNSPCNPTGAAFGRRDWEPILDLVARSQTLILSDEIYEDIVFSDEGHVSPLHVRPELADRTCVVSGLSKAFAMTGWRIGYAMGPADWIRAMSALQGHTTSNINAVTQQAALVALDHRELIGPMVEKFAARRSLVLQRLAQLPMVSAHEPEGTFYIYLDVTKPMQSRGDDTSSLARWLLEEHAVAVIPGVAFGDDTHLRLSFAASEATLNEAWDRLANAFAMAVRPAVG